MKMTLNEAAEEIKNLEYYNRVFDNTPESCEKMLKKEKAIDMAISSLGAWDKVIQEVSDIQYTESLNHDSFDEYSEGRYDVASHVLRIINKYLNEVQDE